MSFPTADGKGGSASPSDGSSQSADFPRTCRLTSRRQFLAVRARGRSVSSSSFTLVGMRNQLDTCRLGLTVSRKVGGAVRRNRVKRMLREVFRYNRAELAPHLDLVVLAKPGIHVRAVADLQAEFLSDFRELARKVRA